MEPWLNQANLNNCEMLVDLAFYTRGTCGTITIELYKSMSLVGSNLNFYHTVNIRPMHITLVAILKNKLIFLQRKIVKKSCFLAVSNLINQRMQAKCWNLNMMMGCGISFFKSMIFTDILRIFLESRDSLVTFTFMPQCHSWSY